jgi:hypothetical protein
MTKQERALIDGKLIAFARWAIAAHREECGDLDGSDIQEKLINLGLLIEVRVNEPCGEYCKCAEYYAEFPAAYLRTETGVLEP